MEDRERLAEFMRELATLLDLSGVNPFKIRAVEGAARFLETTSTPLAEMLENPPKGFGKGLLEKVVEFRRTGRLAELETLKASFPPGLFEMLKVQGLGPKKVKVLFEILHLTNLEELEMACRSDRLLEVKGFGAKTQANILQGLEFMKKFHGQFLFSDAEDQAGLILEFMKKNLREVPVVAAGSLRRHKELVKDIDLLAASDGSRAVMQALLAYPQVERVLAEGETKSSILLKSGLQVDMRVVPPDSFGPALCYFTGSKEHNMELRSLALEKGLKLNEYGLYKGEITSPMGSEEEVYGGLGLPYIPPELREGLGEIEWAQTGKLPKLVESADLLGALHAHTTFSDGRATVGEMGAAAAQLGLSWLGLTDHSRSAHYANGLDISRVKDQWAAINGFNTHSGKCRILKGIESDILPDGSLDYPDDILAGFDFVVVSVHTNFTMTTQEMTRRVIKAMDNPFASVWGHPTGRLLLERESYNIDIDAVLAECARRHVAVEINSNPHRLDLDWRKVRAHRDLGLKFVIGPDAHDPSGLSHIKYGIGIARKGGLEKGELLNSLPADQVIEFFKAGRKAKG